MPECTRLQCQYAPPLCALCALNAATSAGGGGGPYGATNRSSENDVMTVAGIVFFLLGIDDVFMLRDAAGRADLLFVRGLRVVGVDMQSGPSPAHPAQPRLPDNFLDTVLRAAANGYDTVVISASMHDYFTADGTPVGHAMGPGPRQVRKSFVRAVSLVLTLILPALMEPGWQIVNSADAAAAAPGFPVEILIYMHCVNGVNFVDNAIPSEVPAPPAGSVAAQAAVAAHAAANTTFVAPSFRLMTDFVTGQAHSYAGLLYLLARMGTFLSSRLGPMALLPPAASLPIQPPHAWLWDAAADGPPSASLSFFCMEPQAGAFLNRGLFPIEYTFTGRNYTETRGLAPRFALAVPAGAVVPEFFSLEFSRNRFVPPAPVQVHNPVMPGGAAVPAGGLLLETSFLGH